MAVEKAQLEALLCRIVTKLEPKLEGKLRVEWGGRAIYQVSQNGDGAVLKTGLAPGDKRLNLTLAKAAVAALQIIEGRPFSMPAPPMTPNERRGWDELVKLGARPFSNEAHSLDIRLIPLRRRGKIRIDLARLTHALTLVVGSCAESANQWFVDGRGTPIGVYTKERKQ